jgi:hypothetical protein
MNMNLIEFLELFFVIAGGMAMPFIVIGGYFLSIPRSDRNKPVAIFFLIITILYALSYSYFS